MLTTELPVTRVQDNVAACRGTEASVSQEGQCEEKAKVWPIGTLGLSSGDSVLAV